MQQLVADSAVTVYDVTEVSVRQTLVRDRALGRVTLDVPRRRGARPAGRDARRRACWPRSIGLRATAWLAPLGGLLGAAILWWSPVRLAAGRPIAGRRRADRPGPRRAVAVDAERDQPVGG